jgi:hypothetical protein
MDRAEHQPWDIHLDLASEREPVSSLVNSDIGKNWFYQGQALRVDARSLFSIDFFHHLLGETLANGDCRMLPSATLTILSIRDIGINPQLLALL